MLSDKKDRIIGKDFQGWPIYKMSYREILEALGFKHIDGTYQIPDDSELLEQFPICVEDDGMGYGVNEKYISCVNSANMFFIDKEQKDLKFD